MPHPVRTRPFPVPDPTVSYWRTVPHPLDSYRSTSKLPDRSDVIIIGAGFTGATAAYHLLKNKHQGPCPQVTLLEAREACSGATGRNGGHLRPDVFLGVAENRERFGLHVANEIGLFELANVKAVTRLITEEHIECEFRECTTGHVVVDELQAQEQKRLYDDMLGACPTVEHVTYHGPTEAEHLSSIKGAKAAFTFPAATIWPYKMVLGLLEIAVSNGLNLQTRTPALSVSDTIDRDGFWSITTARGVTKAKQVIFATNAYTSGVLPEFQDHLIPLCGMMGRIVPLRQPSEARALMHSSLTIHPGYSWDYHAVQPDGSLIVGGAFVTHNHHPSRYNVFDDSKLYANSDGLFDGWMQSSFDGWKDAEIKVANTWTGIMAHTSDRLPHVGRVPGKPGQFISAGFMGHGMPNVFLCAKGIVQMMQTGCSLSETGVPACYETSSSRLPKKSTGQM